MAQTKKLKIDKIDGSLKIDVSRLKAPEIKNLLDQKYITITGTLLAAQLRWLVGARSDSDSSYNFQNIVSVALDTSPNKIITRSIFNIGSQLLNAVNRSPATLANIKNLCVSTGANDGITSFMGFAMSDDSRSVLISDPISALILYCFIRPISSEPYAANDKFGAFDWYYNFFRETRSGLEGGKLVWNSIINSSSQASGPSQFVPGTDEYNTLNGLDNNLIKSREACFWCPGIAIMQLERLAENQLKLAKPKVSETVRQYNANLLNLTNITKWPLTSSFNMKWYGTANQIEGAKSKWTLQTPFEQPGDPPLLSNIATTLKDMTSDKWTDVEAASAFVLDVGDRYQKARELITHNVRDGILGSVDVMNDMIKCFSDYTTGSDVNDLTRGNALRSLLTLGPLCVGPIGSFDLTKIKKEGQNFHDTAVSTGSASIVAVLAGKMNEATEISGPEPVLSEPLGSLFRIVTGD